ncbi:MAG: hypothetical protein F4Y65_08945 [Gammaproteobacteria bacterium]|nr:hypothetical protein [Gammaproteobacteria bacterium]
MVVVVLAVLGLVAAALIRFVVDFLLAVSLDFTAVVRDRVDFALVVRDFVAVVLVRLVAAFLLAVVLVFAAVRDRVDFALVAP